MYWGCGSKPARIAWYTFTAFFSIGVTLLICGVYFGQDCFKLLNKCKVYFVQQECIDTIYWSGMCNTRGYLAMTVLGALFMTASFIPILFFMSCSQPPPLEPEKLRSSLSEKASKAHPWYPVYEHVKPPGVKLGCWWNTQFFFKRMVADLFGPSCV
mmetsp:Transcript_25366/g.55117  ORF Transcript_25366/g.55117 Transcript_25366/m.55117 type:complete len:156 (+) Transcript_25366:181-648(+)